VTASSRFVVNPSVLLDGSRGEQTAPLVLSAGPLSLRFEDGGLRYVRYGELEVVRRVYCAVRDENWGTVPDKIENLRADVREDSFRLEFDVENRQAEIDFVWRGTITGEATGRIVFEMDGIAKRAFRKNRIGFCILHPMELAGTNVEVFHVNGSTQRAEFPRYICAESPFLNVVGMQHPIEPGVDIALSFEGDVFETEDQRNWIDASFKTFCTPLERPFPVEIRTGERIFQRVVIELRGQPRPTIAATYSAGAVTLELSSQTIGPLPQIGFSLPLDQEPLTSIEIQRLLPLKPAHLRCEMSLSGEFSPALQRATDAAKKLETALELALFVGPMVERELDRLIETVNQLQPPIVRWTFFPADGWCTTRELAEFAASQLRRHDPTIPIGGGTPANFRELNCQRPPSDALDFITWSMTPQIHAFDNASIVETSAAQAATVESARQFAGGRPLVVGPITFKMQVNPYATGSWPPSLAPGQLPSQVDLRQMSLLGAGWTLASLKYLAESQIHAATYYDLVGWKGLMEREAGSPLPALFPSPPRSVFPLYHVFADLAELTAARVLPVWSSAPLCIDCLAVQSGSLTRLLVANLTEASQTMSLPVMSKSARIRMLDQHNVLLAMTDPEAYRMSEIPLQPPAADCLRIDLLPYALACIDLK
jgi:hypothetical protein